MVLNDALVIVLGTPVVGAALRVAIEVGVNIAGQKEASGRPGAVGVVAAYRFGAADAGLPVVTEFDALGVLLQLQVTRFCLHVAVFGDTLFAGAGMRLQNIAPRLESEKE